MGEALRAFAPTGDSAGSPRVAQLRRAKDTTRLHSVALRGEDLERFEDSYSDESFDEFKVVPEMGMGLFFVHGTHHRGEAVTRGRKYVLRTDVMFGADADDSGEVGADSDDGSDDGFDDGFGGDFDDDFGEDW